MTKDLINKLDKARQFLESDESLKILEKISDPEFPDDIHYEPELGLNDFLEDRRNACMEAIDCTYTALQENLDFTYEELLNDVREKMEAMDVETIFQPNYDEYIGFIYYIEWKYLFGNYFEYDFKQSSMEKGLNNLLNELVKAEVEKLQSNINDLSKLLNQEQESEVSEYTKCHLIFCQNDGSFVTEKYIHINTNGHDMDEDYYYDIMTDSDREKLEKIVELILMQEHREDSSIVLGCIDLGDEEPAIAVLPTSSED